MYLGIDIGTSGVKAVLLSEAGDIMDQATAPLTVQRPYPLWSEQDPESWWSATNAAVTELDAGKRRQVRAVGLSGQMHGATCLDAKGQVVRPAILWNDGRSAASCAAMTEALPSLPDIAGNLAMPGFTAPKLHWLREHEPDAFAKTEHVMLPKDYVRYRMNGTMASDMSDSAGTLWMDVAARDWSDELLAVTGLTRANMPELVEGTDATGTLSAETANAWGMERVPVAGGGGDNAAGAVGSGIVAPGEGFVSLGTSGVVFVATDTARPDPASAVHAFCHAVPDTWHQMSVTLSAASAVDFVAKLTGYGEPSELYADAQARDRPSEALFLPYLSGERTPHNDPNASGVFHGLRHEHDRVELGQAALEGVAFALADGLDALRGAGTKIDRLSVIGGGSRSRYWGRILASAFGTTLNYRGGAAVGPALGAARLARLCLGEDKVADVCTAPPIDATVEPDAELSGHYAARREAFRSLYTNTKDI